jgi:hypothetical protein
MAKNPDYSKAIIYKIVCNDDNIKDCYVGSTCNFAARRRSHRAIILNPNRKHHNLYVYSFIRANKGWSNWTIVEIEKYNAINKEDLHKRERHYIEQFGATLNQVIPTRTIQERNEINKEYIKDRVKKYNVEHKEEIKQRCKKYYEKNKEVLNKKSSEKYTCECGTIVIHGHKSRHEKTTKHLELLKEKNGENNQNMNKKFICICGSKFTGHKTRHEQTKKHLDYLKNNKDLLDKMTDNTNEEKVNKKFTCICGSDFDGHKSRHMRSKKHLKYLEEHKNEDKRSSDDNDADNEESSDE